MARLSTSGDLCRPSTALPTRPRTEQVSGRRVPRHKFRRCLGYGFSGKAGRAFGWNTNRIARALGRAELGLGIRTLRCARRRLGCRRLRRSMAKQAPPWGSSGSTSLCPRAHPPDVAKPSQCRDTQPTRPSGEERAAYEQLNHSFTSRSALNAPTTTTRPQTLYGLADSPVGLASLASSIMVTQKNTPHPPPQGPSWAARSTGIRPASLTRGNRPVFQRHHALLANKYRRFFRASLFGKLKTSLYNAVGHRPSVSRASRLPGRELSSAAQNLNVRICN